MNFGNPADPHLAAHVAFTKLGTWAEGTPVQKNWQAVRAVREALTRAAAERPVQADLYRAEARKAAYKLLSNDIPTIFSRGAAFVAKAPKAAKWLAAIAKESAAALAPLVAGKAPAKTPSAPRAPRAAYSVAPPPPPAAIDTVASETAPGFVETYKWPLLGGAALLLIGAGIAFWPRRS